MNPSNIFLSVEASFKKLDGTLILTQENVLHWQPKFTPATPTNVPSVHLPLSQIKSQLVSKSVPLKLKLIDQSDNPYLFTFTSPASSSTDCESILSSIRSFMSTQFISSSSATPSLPTPSIVPAASTSPSPTKSIQPNSSTSTPNEFSITSLPIEQELQLRASLLAQHRSLSKLHQELVRTGHVSESDFWKARKHLLETARLQLIQERGRSSAWTADQKPHTGVGSERKVTLTPQSIRAIFHQYPQVLKLYETLVPEKLSEKEFWSEYFQAKFVHESLSQMDTSSKSSKNGDLFQLLTACFQNDSMNLDSTLASRSVHPLLNLESTASNHLTDAELEPDLTIKHKDSVPMLRKFNQHSASILKTIMSSTSKPLYDDPTLSLDLTDLQPITSISSLTTSTSTQPTLTEFELHLPHSLPSSISSSSSISSESSHSHSYLSSTFWEPWTSPSLIVLGENIDSNACEHVAMELTKQVLSRSQNQTLLSTTPPVELETRFLHTQELLRHFYGSQRDPEKQKRLLATLKTLDTYPTSFQYNDKELNLDLDGSNQQGIEKSFELQIHRLIQTALKFH